MSLKINMPPKTCLTEKWGEFNELFCMYQDELAIRVGRKLYDMLNNEFIISSADLVELVDVEINVKRRGS